MTTNSRRHHNFVKTTADFERYNDLSMIELVQDSQDIDAVAESIGWPSDNPCGPASEHYGHLWALVGDGEYISVWGCYNYVPLIDERLVRLK